MGEPLKTSLEDFDKVKDLFEDEKNTLKIMGGPMGKSGTTNVQEISLNKIKLGRNSRAAINKEALVGLMQSIKESGLLQPIGVVKKNGGYEIMYGNRRFLACSKLGFAKIPAIVFQNQKETEVDMKNLTENLQRRNITLIEAGRYMKLLKEQGLRSDEIAIRLGVSKSYVNDCLDAFERVPEEFQKSIETGVGLKSAERKPGTISVNTANKIIRAKKSYKLDEEETRALFKGAERDERFQPRNIDKYAAALRKGKKDYMSTVKPTVYEVCRFVITEEHRDELEEKYVTNGPFRSLTGLFKAILKGEKSVKIDILNENGN